MHTRTQEEEEAFTSFLRGHIKHLDSSSDKPYNHYHMKKLCAANPSSANWGRLLPHQAKIQAHSTAQHSTAQHSTELRAKRQ